MCKNGQKYNPLGSWNNGEVGSKMETDLGFEVKQQNRGEGHPGGCLESRIVYVRVMPEKCQLIVHFMLATFTLSFN